MWLEWEGGAYAGGEAKEEQGEGCDGVHGWLVLGFGVFLYVCSWCGAPSLDVELFVVQNQERVAEGFAFVKQKH